MPSSASQGVSEMDDKHFFLIYGDNETRAEEDQPYHRRRQLSKNFQKRLLHGCLKFCLS